MDSNNTKPCGTVYLVGAGPGDPDLLTLRGLELIQAADVIIYDRLVNPEILRYASADAVWVDVGKQPDRHPVPQGGINKLLISYAQTHRVVVRLKGGDPFVFGRGGEEALALAESGIPFEVVPGITAAIAAAAYAGIPVTHRDYAAAFTLITGHEKADFGDASEPRIDWTALAGSQGTLAFYMGVRNLPVIIQNLLRHGMNPHTPAAIIQQGTTPRQRTVLAELQHLAEEARLAAIAPPAMIVIGQAAQLHGRLNWFESLPLFGQRILVTRAAAQASQLVKPLRRLGAEPIEFPTIAIEPICPNPELDQAIADLCRYQWLIFTSVNAAEIFFARLSQLGLDARQLHRVQIAAIGPATAKKLREYHLIADFVPHEFISEAIVQGLVARSSLAGQSILIPRAAAARVELVDQLTRGGVCVHEIPIYRTIKPAETEADSICAMLRENKLNWLTFTSSSTVSHFFELIAPELVVASRVKIASIGPITSQTLKGFQVTPHCQPKSYTLPDLVQAMAAYRPA